MKEILIIRFEVNGVRGVGVASSRRSVSHGATRKRFFKFFRALFFALSPNYLNAWFNFEKRIAIFRIKQGNQNPQNNMIASFSFSSTSQVTQCSGRDFDSMIKFNASTSEDLSVVPKSLFSIKQVGFTPSSLFFP